MRQRSCFLWAIAILAIAGWPATAQDTLQDKLTTRRHLADYDSELRLSTGRVDIDTMVKRLKELGVTTYYWLIWHRATDWDDLQLFLPKAAAEGIDVWAYLTPPSESPPNFGNYSEPFRLDYVRWGEEIARLSLKHSNLTAWLMDDFYANYTFFTPAYVRQMQTKAKSINPRLAFLPLMYFPQISPKFAEDYHAVIDGAVVAYLLDDEEIERTRAILDDHDVPAASELRFPRDKPSRAGDHITVSQSAQVQPAKRDEITFRERDSFTAATSGYHVKQLLIDGQVAWEADVAGGNEHQWQNVAVDVTKYVRGKTHATVAFRLFEKKGVSNFGVNWELAALHTKGLRLAAEMTRTHDWKVRRQGAFETGFGTRPTVGRRRFHIPFISMTAASTGEFKIRHGDPASPERIAEQLRLSLEALRRGKCDGVVTYCLDKSPTSSTFPLVRNLFHEFRQAR